MNDNQTLGQKRVNTLLQPYTKEKSDLIEKIKNKSSELIDLYEEMRPNSTGEKLRAISVAQTEVETSCMYAIKAVFLE